MGCQKDNPIGQPLLPEFVFRKLVCNAGVYTKIDTVKNDTLVATQLIYGLDAYFHNYYGSILMQIVTVKSFTDTLYDGAISNSPDQINYPVWSVKISLPNVLQEGDSVKVYSKIYGTFWSDSKLQKSIGEFYYFDSTYARIFRYVYLLDSPYNGLFYGSEPGKIEQSERANKQKSLSTSK